MEWFADSGVIVVTIAGNGGAGMVNAPSFADGVITVGAREKALSRFVADNPFVDIYAQAAYEITPETGLGSETQGYDINADGNIDIPLERLSAPSRQLGRGRWIKGSSFAAPQALHRLLPGLQMQPCP